MKTSAIFFGFGLLFGCSGPSGYDLPPPLRGIQEQILHCEYENALAILQQFTVIGNEAEKSFSFEQMGIIYQDAGDNQEFDHTLERFMFSKTGRTLHSQNVLEKWNASWRNLREKRAYFTGNASCKKEKMPKKQMKK